MKYEYVMKNKDLVSIIIPVYNVEMYIERCISSILNQKYENFEIICIDDGSTDNSWSILNAIKDGDERIQLHQIEHSGSGSARKAATDIVKGEWILCIDSDDWIEPDMLSYMMNIVYQYNPDIVASGFIRDYGNHYIAEPEHILPGYYKGSKMHSIKNSLVDFDHFARFNISPSLCNKMIRSRLVIPYLTSIPIEVTIDEDTVCSYPAIWDADSIYVTDKCFYHYCQNIQSVMHNVKPDRTQSILETYKYLNCIAHNHGDIRDAIRECQYLETYAWCGFSPEHIFKYENEYLFGYGYIPKNSKIVLYGAGSFGRHIYKYLTEHTDINIVAWVDQNGDNDLIMTPDILTKITFDKILIGVLLFEIVTKIKGYLLDLGISEEMVRSLSIQCNSKL